MPKGDYIKVKYEDLPNSINQVDWTVEVPGRELEVTRDVKGGTTTLEESTRSGTTTRKITIRTDKIVSIEEGTSRA